MKFSSSWFSQWFTQGSLFGLLWGGLILADGAFPAEQTKVPERFVDDFIGYPEGSAGEPNWDAWGMGFEVKKIGKETILQAEEWGGRGVMVWHKPPPLRAGQIEALVTPNRSLGGQWKTAGIGLYLNRDNFWHLAFVEDPQGNRHFVELSEMLAGHWNSQFEKSTRLTTVEETPAFAWRYGQTYRLRLTLARGEKPMIKGEVFEGDTLRFRCVRLLDNKAVVFGRPSLNVSDLAANFRGVRAEVVETASPAEIAAANPARTFPPFAAATPLPDQLPKVEPAPGFFRSRELKGVWWLIDPQGQPTLSVGTDHISYHGHWCEKLGYAPYHRNMERQYGSEEAWAKETVQRLRSWNFNVLGANNSPATRYQGLAHTEFLSFGADFSGIAALVPKTTWTGFPDVFDPRFVRFCELRARERCRPNRDDPWLLGYFLDNELEWWGKTHQPWGMALDTAKLPAERAGKKALCASLRATYKNDLAGFNADFGLRLKTFDELATITGLPAPAGERGRQALMAFIDEVATRYFQITTAAVRKHDPNHLILGNRFAHDAPDAAWEQAGRTCDIVTVNLYPRIHFERAEVIGQAEHLRSKFALCRKPMIVTEWSFSALDAKDSEGRPLPSRHGAGMRLDTQAQRARCYAIMQRALFSTPFVIGSHYFMWADEPAFGISSTFPEDSNYGLVSEKNEPYPEMTATAAKVNAQACAIHGGKPGFQLNEVAPLPPVVPTRSTDPTVPSTINFERTGESFTIITGPLRLVKSAHGLAFDSIAWKENKGEWLELGSYHPVLWQVVSGQNFWVKPDRVDRTEIREQARDKLVLDVTFSHNAATTAKAVKGTPLPASGPQPWRATVRFTFKAGQPWFLAQMLWVENPNQQPLPWRGYYHYLPSRIGGDAADDESSIDVPNYWRQIGSWRDPKLHLHIGVMSLRDDPRLQVNFWKDPGGQQHPDCHRKMEGELPARGRWQAEADEPTVAIFGARATPARPRPWFELSQQLSGN